MSSLVSGTGLVRSMNADVVEFFGSFQGFAQDATGVASYLSSQTRGNWFAVSSTTAGIYNVTLNANLKPLVTYTSTLGSNTTSNATAPGWPAGILQNPLVWLTNDVTPANPPNLAGGTSGGIATTVYVYASALTTGATVSSSFIIYVARGISTSIAVPNTDRVNFRFAWKLTGYTP